MKHLTVLVVLAGALPGCYGPIRSTKDILDAEVAIESARTAGAERKAKYEWTAANLYIHKAREEVAYSNYGAGVDFAAKASSCAEAARMKALNQEGTKAAKEALTECHPPPEEQSPAPTEDVSNPKG